MLAKERQDMIVSLVNKNGSVLVKNLSEQFSVTEDSIRKDLTLLQKKGLLKKTYGGAVKLKTNEHNYFVSQRKGEYLDDKKEIAKKALKLIENKDVIFLDISTVNLELIQLLMKSELSVTVVTNMIDVMLMFKEETKVKLVFLGGTLSDGKEGFTGSMTNRQIEKFRFDKAFMGVVGVDLADNAVTTYHMEDGNTKRVVLQNCAKAYMMLETRKFNSEGNYIYANIEDFTGAILDKKVDNDIQKQMNLYSIEWIV